MLSIIVGWALTAAPHPWSARQILVDTYDTSAECSHEQIARIAVEIHEARRYNRPEDWVWQCRPIVVHVEQRKPATWHKL